jgi:uncharacterized membrane protein
MMLRLDNAIKTVLRREKTVLFVMMAVYAVVLIVVCLWKYGLFAYNAIDLAYFNQVFRNMLHGQFFTGSIHPHSSLGDHAELAMPLLLPLYALFPDPRTLLILQTIALALPAWPLFLIAKRRMAGSRLPDPVKKMFPLIAALLYLACPFVQNVNVFEFHILPFALLPLFLAVLEYEKGRKWPFIAWILLALLVREDVALVVGAIGLMAWLEKKKSFWILAPMLLAGLWFLGAMKLISLFAPAGGYKFMIYYAWLGKTPLEMLWNSVRHPLRLLGHILTFSNLEMLLGFGMPFVYIFFLRPKRLILAAGPLLQIILGSPGGGELILQMHYASLFLPALFLASIEGAEAIPAVINKMSSWRIAEASELFALIFVGCSLYGCVVQSPLLGVAARLISPGDGPGRAAAAEALLARIPPDASVAASYALLPQLSSRASLYSLHYQFLGVSQFALNHYAIPADTRFVALDTDDLVTFKAQFAKTGWAEPHYAGGFDRLRSVIGSPVFSRGYFSLFDGQAAASGSAPTPLEPVPDQKFDGGIRLTGADVSVAADPVLEGQMAVITTAWAADKAPADDLVMRLRLMRTGGGTAARSSSSADRPALDQSYPLANGLVPTSELSAESTVGTLTLPLAGLVPGTYWPEISLEKQNAIMILDGIRSVVRYVMTRQSFGSAVLPAFTVGPAGR